jgi:hypothetical protein
MKTNDIETKPRIRKYSKTLANGDKVTRYEVLDADGVRVREQGSEGFDNRAAAQKLLQDVLSKLDEAKSAAQQAAIAVNMKKQGKKPKSESMDGNTPSTKQILEKEEQLEEADLIISPNLISRRDSSFRQKGQDHEVQMAMNDCYQSGKNAAEIFRMLRDVSEQQGIDGWVASKLTLAADYLNTVREYLEGRELHHMALEGENKRVKGGDPCWSGYQMVGTKKKGGKTVPNCVPAAKKKKS